MPLAVKIVYQKWFKCTSLADFLTDFLHNYFEIIASSFLKDCTFSTDCGHCTSYYYCCFKSFSFNCCWHFCFIMNS